MAKIHYKSVMDPIPIKRFLSRTGINLNQLEFNQWDQITHVVAPRDLTKVLIVENMSVEYLYTLLKTVGMLGRPDKKIYANTEIHMRRIDPYMLSLGQRFIYRDHYTAIMENLSGLFSGFTVPRFICVWTPYLLIGLDASGQYALAHYVPPIVEEHGNKFILLDGIHRSFIARQSGTLESIVISGVGVEFPCVPHSWSEVKIIEKKPEHVDVKKRHFGLKVELFRDLRGIGIDG